ncbi:hypothetical protein A9Q99_07145 [Gammaproteobacteria bacterium 45_16_T64]|nr:hypothetical protein A9Q99_07145 [Gammaproteobacteria bacterium 45_16_T64]
MDSSNISFTALYTGHVWFEHGMSARFFTSPRSSIMYNAMKPFEYFSKKVVGVNLRDLLLQRHLIMDHRIRQLIENEGVTQIIEIACGLSPRGYTFSKEYPNLRYVEADLPGMASRKKSLLEEEGGLADNHEVVTCNFFESGAPSGLDYVLQEVLDTSRPTIIITEGLINYFDLDTISGVWSQMQSLSSVFPNAWYLTDLMPRLKHSAAYKYVRIGEKLIGKIARADVNLHYSGNQEIFDGFQACGFSETTVHQPEDYYDTLPIPQSRSESVVRVVEAKV